MEDIRPYGKDLDETLRDREEQAAEREGASKDDELPFEIPRD
ncbi:MAG TPA: hypothetical protein VJ853_12795 [Thermoanaerobaculia bacterium]|nr:hypothetical protein [Thermoanaerobaculia bacterium]